MKINSIFLSLEGEGINIGVPEIFVRFQGCGMKCKNCDTPEAKNPNRGRNMSVDKIIEKIKRLNYKRVVLTGGTPLEQNIIDLKKLIRKLKIKNYFITLEATGCDKITPSISDIFNKVDFISFDVKSPSTGVNIFERGCMRWGWKSQYKIIVSDEKDYKFAKQVISKYTNSRYKFIITPCWNVNRNINIKFIQKIWKNILRDKLNCRVILQQHKVVYGSNKVGV